jgi:hypothetical protein
MCRIISAVDCRENMSEDVSTPHTDIYIGKHSPSCLHVQKLTALCSDNLQLNISSHLRLHGEVLNKIASSPSWGLVGRARFSSSALKDPSGKGMLFFAVKQLSRPLCGTVLEVFPGHCVWCIAH